jgi:hypothetical protein
VRDWLTRCIAWADYSYVGGYYGNLSENHALLRVSKAGEVSSLAVQLLQRELMLGPLVVGIDAHYDLLHYQVSEIMRFLFYWITTLLSPSPILKHENENAVWNILPHSNGFPARPIEPAQCSAAGPRNFEDVGVHQSCSALSGLGRECVWRALLDYQELMGQRMGRGAELFMFHLNSLTPTSVTQSPSDFDGNAVYFGNPLVQQYSPVVARGRKGFFAWREAGMSVTSSRLLLRFQSCPSVVEY